MKSQIKTILVTVGIISVTMVGVPLLYNFDWRHEGRNIKNGTDTIRVKHGCDIVTTLDLKWQKMADSVLRVAMAANTDIESGCVIMMDVKSGALPIIVNLGRDDESGDIIENAEDGINRRFQPGSLAKVLPLAAALEDGHIHSLDETVPTHNGKLKGFIKDVFIEKYERKSGSKSISILDGFTISSNYVVAYIANKYYVDYPGRFDDHIQKYCDIFDFQIPEKYRSRRDVLIRSMGYNFRMTPLSVLTLYNTIANKGKKMMPYWNEYQDGKPLFASGYGPDSHGQVMPVAVADTLMRALRTVNKNETGTSHNDAYPRVAGKPSTSRLTFDKKDKGSDPFHDEEGHTKTAAAYVGIVPADAPAYSIICVIFSKPTFRTIYGSSVPAHVVRDIISGIYE